MCGGFETLASPKLHGVGDVDEDRIGDRSSINPFAFGLNLETSNCVLETAISTDCNEDYVQEGNASKIGMSSSADVALVNFISLGIRRVTQESQSIVNCGVDFGKVIGR
jgi:hypothetical protein